MGIRKENQMNEKEQQKFREEIARFTEWYESSKDKDRNIRVSGLFITLIMNLHNRLRKIEQKLS